MKLIKQSFQFVNQKGFTLRDIYKHIEYCARISYKSQDKITDTSYEKFVNMLESREGMIDLLSLALCIYLELLKKRIIWNGLTNMLIILGVNLVLEMVVLE